MWSTELWIEILAWTLLVGGCLAGLAFVILPFVPGPLLVLAGVLAHKLMLPEWISWWTFGALVFIAVLERLADVLGTLAGARWMGASRWGLLGAAIGGIVGLFFGIVGIFVGPVIGAVVAEIIVARRQVNVSVRAGMGAGVGIGVATIARLALTIFMIMATIADLLFY